MFFTHRRILHCRSFYTTSWYDLAFVRHSVWVCVILSKTAHLRRFHNFRYIPPCLLHKQPSAHHNTHAMNVIGVDFNFDDLPQQVSSFSFPTQFDTIQEPFIDDAPKCSRCRWGGCDVRITSCGCSYHAVSLYSALSVTEAPTECLKTDLGRSWMFILE